jgi:hypothetical protein
MDTNGSVNDDVLARAMRRLGQRAGAALGGASLVGAALAPVAGCAVDGVAVGAIESESWATEQGQRNTEMVRFTGESWSSCRYPNTRFGCGALDIVVKLRVTPVANVDLAWKRVGIAYKTVGTTSEQTAIGYYVGSDGSTEEWHVPVTVYANQATLLFDAWYQDGGGRTFVDDNQGERHVVNTSYAYSVLRVEPWNSTLAVDDTGVRGRLTLQVADLDYDKEIVLVGTTDGWQTVVEMPIGQAGETNRWVWVEKFPWSAWERWQIDIDLPGAGIERFQYAVVYRHGVVNGARPTDFWDNNYNYNYTVERPAPEPEPEPDTGTPAE